MNLSNDSLAQTVYQSLVRNMQIEVWVHPARFVGHIHLGMGLPVLKVG